MRGGMVVTFWMYMGEVLGWSQDRMGLGASLSSVVREA
jgi:hypothetical protein